MTIPAVPNKIAKIRKFLRLAIVIIYLFLIYLLEKNIVLSIERQPKTASSILTVSVP